MPILKFKHSEYLYLQSIDVGIILNNNTSKTILSNIPVIQEHMCEVETIILSSGYIMNKLSYFVWSYMTPFSEILLKKVAIHYIL